MLFSVEIYILIFSILLFVSLFAEKASLKFGTPILLLFLAIGMLAGSDGVGLEFHDSHTAQAIGIVALNIILFSGGMSTKQEEIKPVLIQGFLLSTIGVLLTAFITGLFIYWLTNNIITSIAFSFLESMLLASVMSSTDSASVFGILRLKKLSLKERLRPMLEFESGSNDPMAYMLTITIIGMMIHPENSFGLVALDFFLQLFIGGFLGFFLGRISVKLINKINLENDSLYSVLLITCMFFIFSFTHFLKGNGYLAVYLGGLVIGNSKFIHKRSVVKFFDGLTWLFQIVMFLTLGLLVNPSELLPISLVSILIGVFMILFSRPISVFATLLPFKKMTTKAKVYVSWVGLRGAVPIIFATYPLIAEIPQARIIFNIVFFITILSLVIQGTTVASIANLLNLSKTREEERKLTAFDVEFSEEIKSVMSEVTIKKRNLRNGSKILDMPLPEKTLVVMVKRKEHYFIPRGNTELEVGDILLLISDSESTLKETYEQLEH